MPVMTRQRSTADGTDRVSFNGTADRADRTSGTIDEWTEQFRAGVESAKGDPSDPGYPSMPLNDRPPSM